MRTLGALLLAAGLLSFLFTLAGARLLPEKLSSPELAIAALGVGIVLVWLSEVGRQRRKWKSLDKKPRYYD